MSVIRINKNKNYSVISNNHFKEKEMSLKAKGLLSEMLSLPENWNYTVQGLVAINKENETAIKSTLDELKEFGYLKITKLMPNETKTGRIEYIYDIFEEKQEGKKQGVENLGVEILGVENLCLYKINNNKVNKNKINNKIYYEDMELNNLFLEFLELRKKIKAVNTDRAINMLINKLSKYDDDTKKQMIEQSIVNSWKDVYEIKTYNGKRKKIDTPEWLNEKQQEQEMTERERYELDELLKDFK